MDSGNSGVFSFIANPFRFQIISSHLLSIVTFARPLILTEILDGRNRWKSISGFVCPNTSNQTEL